MYINNSLLINGFVFNKYKNINTEEININIICKIGENVKIANIAANNNLLAI